MKRTTVVMAAALGLALWTAEAAQAQHRGGSFAHGGNYAHGGVYHGGGWGGVYHGGGWGGAYHGGGWGGYGWGYPGVYFGGRNWGVGLPLTGSLGSYGYYGGYSYPNYTYSYPAYTGDFSYPVYSGGYVADSPPMIVSPNYSTGSVIYPNTSGGYASFPGSMDQRVIQGSGTIVNQPTGSSDFQFTGSDLPRDKDKAYVDVMLPRPDARVWFGDQPTGQTGQHRIFVSPSLQANKDFVYTIKAQWMENGQEVTRQKDVDVRAGQQAHVSFVDNAQGGGRNLTDISIDNVNVGSDRPAADHR